jgi:hypothetical protein
MYLSQPYEQFGEKPWTRESSVRLSQPSVRSQLGPSKGPRPRAGVTSR